MMPVQFHGGAEVNSLCPVVEKKTINKKIEKNKNSITIPG